MNAPDTHDQKCDKCGAPMAKKQGRFGAFLACSGYPGCRNTRQLEADAADEGPDVDPAVLAERCPEHAEAMVVKRGRFGPFLACTRYPECKQTTRLVPGREGRLEIEQQAPLDEKCPLCESPLAWRRGRFGAFAACSNYPACKYVKKKDAREIGLLCPDCGEGQVVERKGRWGRFFYGCRRYPVCRFTVHDLPVAEPCPDCGRAYLLRKETKKQGTVIFCSDQTCSYRKTIATP